jgi:Ca2+:H+ antiporter
MKKDLLKPSLSWLLIFVVITPLLHYLRPAWETAAFFCACAAIIPLAGWLGKGTEHLAEKVGEGLGGLLNATLGNAAELIIALVALRSGLHDIVKASLTGSIIGNILLVLGAAFYMGGIKFETQRFNAAGARSQASMLTLAGISLILPACYHFIAGPAARLNEQQMSFAISTVLILVYIIGLWFSLKTHRHFFSGTAAEKSNVEQVFEEKWSLTKCLTVLLVSTALIAWMSEILVGTVEHAAHGFGMTSVFVGVIVVAIVGNAAEHSTAILVAMKNRMDLSIGIAVGSSIQIALFVAPLLVLLSAVVGPHPMDLVFTPAEILCIGFSVYIVGQVAGDGESNWLEGIQLLALYLIIGIVFFFLPESAGVHP